MNLSERSGECRSGDFLYNENDQSGQSGTKGDLPTLPLIIILYTGEGSFKNSSKTLKWFNNSVFAKKLVGQISVPGRLTADLHPTVQDGQFGRSWQY